MIFVTVGTHEQQFNRLIECIDKLAGKGVIGEDVFIQTGYSSYVPRFCEWTSFLPYSQMVKMTEKARVIISHGGPSSFILPLQMGKIPVVVPRRKEFGEHVNDHQLEFVREAANRMGNIIPVYEVDELPDVLKKYDEMVKSKNIGLRSNNQVFNQRLTELVKELFSGEFR